MEEKCLNINSDREITPSWLIGVLQLTKDWEGDWEEFQQPLDEPIPQAFQERLNVTVDAALSLARLRRERERVGFRALPLDEYLRELAKQANVSLAFVLARFGLGKLASVGVESAEALARLAKTLGIELRELLAYLRLGVASRFNFTPSLLLARQRSSGGWRNPARRRSLLEECEAALEWLERNTDRGRWAEMRRLTVAIKSAWGDETGSEESGSDQATAKES